ncbi:alpha/beta fold hydrolase [Actinoplanes sp. NPDC049265]|uniref:alpha/beta fold hydrolase n=1 Tax=Actinoplanes sp. NPDC049265 TaxID=3363902 RepID=UPI003721F0CF
MTRATNDSYGRVLRLSGMTMFGKLAGTLTGSADDRPPLVLLHGLTFDRRQWGPLVRELAAVDRGRRVLALDLPGHGGSRDVAYDTSLVGALVHEAVAAAGLGAPVVVGHSVGGVLATMYAAHFPAAGVVNLDQALIMGPFGDLVRRSEPRLRGPRWREEVWDRLLAGMGVDELPAEGRELVESCVPRADQLLGYWDDIFRHSDAAIAGMRRDELGVIAARGIGYHWVTSAEPEPVYVRWLTGAVPGVAITVLPGGHFPHLSHPAEVAALLVDRSA